jgi:hypothetical protein
MSSAFICIIYLTLVGFVSLAQAEKAKFTAVQPLGWKQGFVFQFSDIKIFGDFFQNDSKISQILNQKKKCFAEISHFFWF